MKVTHGTIPLTQRERSPHVLDSSRGPSAGFTAGKVLVAQLCPTLCLEGYSPWDSPGRNTGVGCCFLLQGILQKGERDLICYVEVD